MYYQFCIFFTTLSILSISESSLNEIKYEKLPSQTEIVVQTLSKQQFSIQLKAKDIDGSYDNVTWNGVIHCVNSKWKHFSKNLLLDSESKQWISPHVFTEENCSIDSFFTYEIFAYKKSPAYDGKYKLNGIIFFKDKLNINNNEFETNLNTKRTCKYSKTTINFNQNICKGKLIFEDNFNKMNWTKWNRDIRIPLDTEDADFLSFQNNNENLYIKDDILYILPKLLISLTDHNERSIRTGTLNLGVNCTGVINRNEECIRNGSTFNILPPVVSARITTKDKFSFKYGIIEIRAKLPKGDWLFPQLFLEPSSNHYGVFGYASGQIRIAFIRSNEKLNTKNGKQIDGYRLYGGVVLAPGEEYRELWMKNILKRQKHFADDFHIFKTTWTDEFISFEVDGEEYGRMNQNFGNEAFDMQKIKHAEFWKTGSQMAPFDKEFYLSLGVSVGGISDFPDDSISGVDKKPWINLDNKNQLSFWKAKDSWHSTWIEEKPALKVDYVRVWAL